MSEKWIPSVFDKKFGPGILSHYPPGMHPLAWRYYKKNYACIPLVLISLYDYAFVAFASIYGETFKKLLKHTLQKIRIRSDLYLYVMD
ncbi:unnamed protein product [Acanthoscelides obtectus]|uniref:Uncharacterized protein n=1 Tax=Acanthoscelides obtectus TaxID=200917 RepID=A0A9P0KTB1_ACAOB|nr:unnamed protein product [Acanthoscelides obtectus]CAK1647704.1 hypothetical protein AOBTE_LOCUS15354 [Acanthoscelides obtectus]